MTKRATVKAQVPGATAVDLLLDTDPGLGSPSTVAGTEGSDDVWEFDLTGLAADTTYYYGFDGSDVEGTFKTPDDDGAEFSFTIAVSSCAGHSGAEYATDDVSNAPTFDRIVDRDPFMFLHMGDRHYRDISTNNVTAFRDAYADVMAQSKQLALHLAMTVAYYWSDHDYGANNSGASSASRPAAQQVYREHVPYWPLPSASLIYQTFAIGRTRWFLLDCRSERSAPTMLGATQKAWLLAEMAAATESLLVVCSDTPWNGPTGWGSASFSAERDELIAQWSTDGILSNILILNGDWHFTAADDGTNAPGNIPTIDCRPLDAGWSADSGTYSEGIHKDSHQQYVTLEFDDQSTDIVVTVKGWAVFDAIETEMFSLELTYPA